MRYSNEGPSAVNGQFVGLPEGSPIVVNNVTYVISYKGGANNQSVVLTVAGGPPSPGVPVANYVAVQTRIGQTAAIDLAGHGSDGNGDILTAAVVTQPANGAVVFNAGTGLFNFTPAPLNYTGPTWFTYDVSYNGQVSNTATVAVMVNPGTPIVNVTDNGGTYNGSAFGATATIAGVVAGVDNTPGTSLEGVPVVVAYYVGSAATGAPSYDPPTQAGTYTVVASFAGSADYTATSVCTTFSIAPASLTITGLSGTDKVYDGGTSDMIGGTASLNGVVVGDTVALDTDGASASFADPNVGAGKVVTFSGYTISGADAADYTLTQPTSTADITPAALTLTANDVSMTYADGTTLDDVGFTVTGLQGSDAIDSVTLATNATTSDSGNWNAGSWTIAPSAAVGAAFNASNYGITYVNGSLTVNPASLTLTGVSGTDKVYDGGTNDMIGGTASLNGLVGGDTVALAISGASASFADPNAGAGKVVTFAGYTVSGADAGNYILSQPTSSTADITQASPIITWNNPANVTFGTALNGMQLNASANVPGSFVYTPAAGTILNVGSNQTLSVTFTPTDTIDYTAATQTAAINVNPPPVTVTLSNPGNQTCTAGNSATAGLLGYASNGDSVTYSASGLPPGLSMTNGTISGTIASNAGSTTPYAVTVTATDALANVSATQYFTWTVNPPLETVDLTNPGNQTNSAGNTDWLTLMAYASNGDLLTYTATGLPPGLTIGNGTISGTIASDAGSGTPYTVTITATDSITGISMTVSLSWTVA